MFPNRINYAEIKDGQVIQYPVCPIVVNPITCESNLPVNWNGGVYEGKEYVFCHNFEPFCDYKHNLMEVIPKLNPDNGLWYRQYEIIPATEEEIAERTKNREDIMLNQINEEVKKYQENQEYYSNLSLEQQQDWSQFIQEVQNLPQLEDFPWVNYPTRPSTILPTMGVERL